METQFEDEYAENFQELKDSFMQATERCVRVNKQLARHLLLQNLSFIKYGRMQYFSIEHIGLNVYRVKLSDKKGTYLIRA